MHPFWNHPLVALIFRVVAAALSFAFGVVAARLLGIEDFGVVSVLIGFINLGVIVAMLGHETLATRVVAVVLARETPVAAADPVAVGYRRKAARQIWMFGALVVVAELALVHALPIGERAGIEFLLLLALVPLIARTRFSQSVIRGASQAGLAIVPDGIARPLLAIVLLCAAWWAGRLAPAWFTGVMVAAGAAALLFGLRCERSIAGNPKYGQAAAQPTETFSMAIYLSSILAALISQLALIAMGVLADPSQAGMYAAAERFALAAALIGQAVYLAVASRLAALYSRGDIEPLRSLIRSVTRRVAVATMALCLAIGLAAQPLLGLYGEGFAGAETALIVLLVSTVVNACSGPTGQVLLMTSHQREHLLAMATSFAVQLVLIVLLVPRAGVVGGALAVLLSTIVWNGVMMYFVRRRVMLNPILAWA